MSPTSTTHKSTCCYCGVGCGIEVTRDRRGGLTLRGDEDHPSNKGLLCSKGRALLHTVTNRQERLLWPTLRRTRKDPLRRTGWDDAITHVASEFKRIIATHGPDAVALYVSGQCLTEEYYVANKLVKGFLGTNNIDTNSRLCMSSAVAGYKATLGADAPPVSYEDLDLADTFLIAGANPAWAHPIIFRRIEARKVADPQRVKLICIDPRRTATAAVSDLHLPVKPGTDVALFHGLAAELWRTGQIDEAFITAHTAGWENLRTELERWTLDYTAEVCGINAVDIATAASWLGSDRRFLSLWTMGLNQSAVGVDKNTALINLSLLTGKIGKPGCGPFSLTGQPNAMGGREVGGLANLLPAHRNLADPKHREEVAAFWGVPALRDKPGLTAMEMLDALHDGRLKAIWVICTNPIASWPDALRAEAAFRKAEFVVVQDIFPTDTTPFADVVLPAATWLEKTGTMTNSERRITLLDKVVEPPGEALADLEILLRFARAMGWEKSFAFADEAAVYREHAALTKGSDCDVSGLDHGRLRTLRSAQWPVPNHQSIGTPRLYTNHRFATADGRAKLAAPQFVNRSEPLSPDFPLVLDTGRLRDQWHTMTKTGRVNKLNGADPLPFCELHPDDAAVRAIHDGDLLDIASRRGAVRVAARVTADIRPGVVFMPMHWGRRLGGGFGRANTCASAIVDPVSKEPDLKWAAVQITAHRPAPRRIVVVGGGAAALGFVDAQLRLSEQGRVTNDRIEVFGEESDGIYNRVLLPHYIDGSHEWAGLMRASREQLAERGVTFHPGRRIAVIDREAQVVRDHAGQAATYDVLVLATGSRANRPSSGPLAKAGALALRSRGDAERIRATALLASRSRPARVVIQGAGLLGIELADALAHMGAQVTILQRSKRLMGKQLDLKSSIYLYELLLDRGITVRLDANLTALVGEPVVSGALLDSGETLPCDLFVFATGTSANTDLAKAAGLPCGAGITVDHHLRTADPAIFAIGECAEHNGKRVGTTAGAEQQAVALAEFLRGNPHAAFHGAIESNILKVRGLQVASCGQVDTDGETGYETIVLEDPQRSLYQKAVIKNDRLVGVVMLGSTQGFAEHRELIGSGLELDDQRDRLLRLGGGGGGGPRGKLVCSCNQVGADDIAEAVTSTCCTLAAVCAKSKAGTSCGSCRPEVQQIIDRTIPTATASRTPTLATSAHLTQAHHQWPSVSATQLME